MRSHVRGLLMLMLGVMTGPVATAGPLEVGKRLAETKYHGWTYGNSADRKQVNCVQFVETVVEESLGDPLDAKTRAAISISNLTAEEQQPQKLSRLVLDGDPRTKGVQTALVDIGRGEAIEPRQAKPGDLIQYWMKRSSGAWYGHAGIIEEVNIVEGIPEAKILGAHKSQNGVQTSKFKLKLVGAVDQRRVYVVRLK